MSTTATANPSFVPQSPSHWVPDEKRSSCKSCHKDFTFFNRRHHCRSCREVFCGECSDFRLLTRDPKDPTVVTSVRACHPCFDKFRGRKIRGQKKKASSGLTAAAPTKARRNSKASADQHDQHSTQPAHQPLEVEMPTQHWEGEDADITGSETIVEEEDEDHYQYADPQHSTQSDAITLNLPSDVSAVDRDVVMATQGNVVLPSSSVHGGLQFVPVDNRASKVSSQDKANLGAVEGSEEILHIPSDALASVKHSATSDSRAFAEREVGVTVGVERLSLGNTAPRQQQHIEPLPETRQPSVVPVSNTANIQGGLHTPVIASAPATSTPLVVGETRQVGDSDSLVEVNDVSLLSRAQQVAVQPAPHHAAPAAQTFTSPSSAPSIVTVGSTAALTGQRIDVSQQRTVGAMVTSPLSEKSLGQSVVMVSDLSRLQGPNRTPVAVSSGEGKADLGAVAGSEEILHIPSDALASVKHSNMSSLDKDATAALNSAGEKDEFGRSVSAVEGSEEIMNIPSDALASVKHSELVSRKPLSTRSEEGEVAWSDRNVEKRYNAASPTEGVAKMFNDGEQQSQADGKKSTTKVVV